jgi:hypothetical protein
MGLLDKVKEQAGTLAEKAQQGVDKGKDRLEELQATKRGHALLQDLGTAYYALQRGSGSQEAVDTALKAMDDHVAEHGHPGEPPVTLP